MKWAVFDLEFTALLPETTASPWAPDVHILCASIMTTDDPWPKVWYEHGRAGMPADFMLTRTTEAFVRELSRLDSLGYTLVTWGGTASDWRMLAKEAPNMRHIVKALAMNSVDVPFCAFMQMGMMMGLNAACKALGMGFKNDSDSTLVPLRWTTASERPSVLQHVCNDSYATMMLVRLVESTASMAWITQRGHIRSWTPAHLWTVKECLQRPLPVTPYPIADNVNGKLLARWLIFDT